MQTALKVTTDWKTKKIVCNRLPCNLSIIRSLRFCFYLAEKPVNKQHFHFECINTFCNSLKILIYKTLWHCYNWTLIKLNKLNLRKIVKTFNSFRKLYTVTFRHFPGKFSEPFRRFLSFNYIWSKSYTLVGKIFIYKSRWDMRNNFPEIICADDDSTAHHENI